MNYEQPSTWATVAPVLATPWTAASSALGWVKANPNKTEGGIGGLLLIGGLAAGAVFARELRGLVGEGRIAAGAAWSTVKAR